MKNLLIFTIVLFITLHSTLCLECYACDRQDGNTDKCKKNIIQCEAGEDVCYTEVAWSSTPYWTQGAIKQYYVSKRCSTKDKCSRLKHSNLPACTYISYDDWKCSDCCKGDRCNYYIISGAPKKYIINTAAVLSTIALFAMCF